MKTSPPVHFTSLAFFLLKKWVDVPLYSKEAWPGVGMGS